MRTRLILGVCAVWVAGCEPRVPGRTPDGGSRPDTGGIEASDSGPAELGSDADTLDGDGAPGPEVGGEELGPESDGSIDMDPCWPEGLIESGQSHTDDRGSVSVTASGPRCQRRYTIESTAPRRSGDRVPRVVEEIAGRPLLRTGHLLFDATYALALDEAGQASVSHIRDGAFNDGAELDCGAAGCFETGANWPYVWSRDTGYALRLGLAFFDPPRAASSLLFKVSDQRGGGSPELVQDTGTGGGWPVSSDRVVLALGAAAVLPYLEGPSRSDFADRFFEALRNTVARDRLAVFDPEDGLYLGEQSFLDWREQSYPAWASRDLVHIGLSKSLSTNVAHLLALRLLAEMADERQEAALAAQCRDQASALAAAIGTRFWLEEEQLPSSFIPTTLDPTPVSRFDLLGLSLAILSEVLTPERARAALSAYPILPFGPPVLWPEEQLTPIYHNRAIWPFVTAFAAKAARRADHATFATHAIQSLFESASLFLSNLENLELVSGLPFLDDGAYSGPVVNSERQLWSIGGYLGVVNEVMFGLEAETDGLRVEPYLPKSLRAALFPSSSLLRLSDFPVRGRRVHVSLVLPPLGAPAEGAYRVRARRLNGAALSQGLVPWDALGPDNHLEVELEEGPPAEATSIRRIADPTDYRWLYAPRTPIIDSVSRVSGGVQLSWQSGGDPLLEVEHFVHRNGVTVAGPLSGNVLQFLDTGADQDRHVPCYTVESRFAVSGHRSHHAKPVCAFPQVDWVQSIYAGSFEAIGGSLVDQLGWLHYQGWGDPGHELVIPNLEARQSGSHLIQIVGGNGAGPRETGVTAGVKRLRVFQLPGGGLVAEGMVFLPHTGSWDAWREGSFLRVDLQGGVSYRVVVDDAVWARNMSALEHFELYTGGLGGRSGSFFRFNVSEIRVIPLELP